MPHDAVPVRALPPVLNIPSGQWQLALDRLRRSDPASVHRWMRDSLWELRFELKMLRLQENVITRVAPVVVAYRQARWAFVSGRLADLTAINATREQRGRLKGGATAVRKARMKSEGVSDQFVRNQGGCCNGQAARDEL